jgi:hypothetical protein
MDVRREERRKLEAFVAEGSVGYIIGGYATERGATDMGKFTLTLRKQPDGGG